MQNSYSLFLDCKDQNDEDVFKKIESKRSAKII